ncbi:MAG: DUF1015 family protein [Candidatus Omnitrophica bacterium]|nr:DUF1015 family protein [Candidatus Omnitrophota bacterium]
MAEIKPFRGVLYNGSRPGIDYVDVVAPPYDVISGKMRDELYEKSPYNIIKLILGKDGPGSGPESRYAKAKDMLDEWIGKGVLEKDRDENFYVYSQAYDHEGRSCERIGFFALMKIDEEGEQVLPHERTHAKPKEDRLNLIKAVRANLSPVFSLFHDGSGRVNPILSEVTRKEAPAVDIEIGGIRNRLWRLADKESIAEIRSVLEDKKLFIADGHHRYEVARTYRDLRKQDPGYDGEADHVMMYMADMADPSNLTVMATHRVIRNMPFRGRAEIEKALEGSFDLTEHKDLESLVNAMKADTDRKVLGMVTEERYLLLTPADPEKIKDLIDGDMTDSWKDLDVSVLHAAVFGRLIPVDSAEGNITYVKDAVDAERLVRDGSHEAAFLLNPTRVEQMKCVAEVGEMMPQKSTYFYPKLLTGLVINKLGD